MERPNETPAERADRNFNDLLQELRVAQTGVQILFAFLLTLPLQSRFESLDQWERNIYVAALLLAAVAAVCMIAPVAYHRALAGRRMKPHVVLVAARFAVGGLFFLALAICSAVNLVLDLVLGRPVALSITGALALLLFVAWVAYPLLTRLGAVPAEEPEDAADKPGQADH